MPFTKITAAGIDTTGTLITQQLSVTGISTVGSLSIGNTSVISSARQLQNIVSLDATTIATVESAIANAPNTFTDLSVSGISTLGSATASSLVVSGVSTVSAGTSALPSITPSGDSNTGIFFPAADTISASTSGTARITIDSSGNITVTNNLIIPLGTVLLPSLAFLSDPNTGLFSPGADQLAISTNGTSRIVVDASGNVNIDSGTFYVDAANNRVGFGTASPSCQLNTVSSSTGELVRFSSSAGSGEINLSVGYTTTNQAKLGYDLGTGDAIISSAGIGTAGILFKQGSTERARIDSSGRLLVGTSSGNANGGILQLSSGITFPATAVAASDANTLDDYEEGTWTPVFTLGSGSVTYTLQQGRYVKVGRLVTISVKILVNTVSSPSGSLQINLPFTPAVEDEACLCATYGFVSTLGVLGAYTQTTNLRMYGVNSSNVLSNPADKLAANCATQFVLSYTT